MKKILSGICRLAASATHAAIPPPNYDAISLAEQLLFLLELTQQLSVVTLTINDVSVTTTVDANGVFSFENIRMDDVIISVDAPRAVAECTAATVGSESVSTGDITVYRGDINKDDVIDIADFTYLSSRFGLSEGENRYKAKADLNKDGVINIQDLAILGGALGIAACDPAAG